MLVCRILYMKNCSVKTCSVKYCSVKYCSVKYCSVRYCSIKYCSVKYCSVLYCAVVLLSGVWRILAVYYITGNTWREPRMTAHEKPAEFLFLKLLQLSRLLFPFRTELLKYLAFSLTASLDASLLVSFKQISWNITLTLLGSWRWLGSKSGWLTISITVTGRPILAAAAVWLEGGHRRRRAGGGWEGQKAEDAGLEGGLKRKRYNARDWVRRLTWGWKQKRGNRYKAIRRRGRPTELDLKKGQGRGREGLREEGRRREGKGKERRREKREVEGRRKGEKGGEEWRRENNGGEGSRSEEKGGEGTRKEERRGEVKKREGRKRERREEKGSATNRDFSN